MNTKAPSILCAVVMALAVGAGIVLVVDPHCHLKQAEGSQEFQRLVGGLGLGPAMDLSQCDFSFDPRIGNVCPEDEAPIPGGVYFCPHHACSIFFYPQSGGGDGEGDVEAQRDAEIP